MRVVRRAVMKRYAVTLIATVAAVLGSSCAAFAVAVALGFEISRTTTLVDERLSILGKGPAPRVVFVGDSSLGNAIDTLEWERLGGGHAVNLGLTATLGYEATYNMLRRALAAWGGSPRVVIMQTAEMMRRPPSIDGLRASEPNGVGRLALEVRHLMSLQQIRRLGSYYKSWAASILRRDPPPHSRWDAMQSLADGYVKRQQRDQAQPAPFARSVDINEWIRTIRPEKAEYLRVIADFCAKHRLRCVYAHGPFAAPPCSSLGPYLRAVDTLIPRSLTPRPPVCLSTEEVGDSIEHATPAARRDVTRRYYEMLRDDLSLDSRIAASNAPDN